MKRIIALLLMLAILLCSCLSLVSCLPLDDAPPIIPGGDNTGENGNENEDTPDVSAIVVPTYKDYERGTIDFDKIVYKRPDVSKLRQDFAAAKDAVAAADTEGKVNEAIELIRALEEPYSDFKTMAVYAQICSYKNSADAAWAEEHEVLSVARSSVAQIVEELIVAAAKSDFIDKYESDYFGYDIDEYRDGGIYSDAVVSLMGRDAELVAEYNTISTATLELTIPDFNETGTYEELVLAAAEKYGTASIQYMMRVVAYGNAYNELAKSKTESIYVDLLKTRKEIANALELSSYTEFMYDQMGYEYSPEQMKAFLADIKGTIFGVYSSLLSELYTHLYDDSATNKPDALSRTNLINTLYSVYSSADADLSEAYSYMLQHKLYDISGSSSARYDGAFTAYLESNSSPFLFATVGGNITDFSNVSHEFGHFYDAYINYDGNNSLELCEVSSQALEYMTLNMIKDKVSQKGYNYLRYYYVYNALTTIIYQGIYSMFEHLAYELPYDRITVANLNSLVSEAATIVTGSAELAVAPYEKVEFNSIHQVLVHHMFISPMYVQSYVTSIIPSIEIYSLEAENKGAGLEVYKQLVDGADEDRSFTEHLKAAGLSSPFDEGILDSVASALFKLAIGRPYSPGGNMAA